MRYRSICTALLLGLGLLLGAQVQQEGLVLLTDRGHYISGETINYKAFYRRPAESSDAAWSRVLYVELIMPNGTPLVQSKVLLDTSTSGSLLIPEGLSSGSYYLKAYTRRMPTWNPK